MASGSDDMAFIRITLLGSAKSGKTSLASTFVSNIMPHSYHPTARANISYTVVRLSGDGHEMNFNALVEIEDTCASDNPAGRKQVEQYYNVWRPTVENSTVKNELEQEEKVGPRGDVRSLAFPFGRYDPFLAENIGEPLTRNRMAYFLVFDINDRNSYTEALRIHVALKEYWAKKNIGLTPVVMLVGNRVDEGGDDLVDVTYSAANYSEYNCIPFHPVSALQFKGVKKLFRAGVSAVRKKQHLFLLEYKRKDGGTLTAEKQCCVQ
eukprot:TRINITY_DN30249_c0_g1_i1.p1 TRINITY_DN30249_c0_g1~~TRINITY_DN30249_c0_g1_i1.p1  ORF type:complete len:265 (+),score=38.42 TRINITY_DN30249_c0_g1_i1:61-855(+)